MPTERVHSGTVPSVYTQQKKIVVSNKSAIRREVNKIGKENKKIEDYEKTRGGNR